MSGPQKYRNQTQLVQGVSQVDEPTLDQAERLFLMTLAAFTVKVFPSRENYPHPGNEKLARACGVTTRQGVNAIYRRLYAKRLAEIVEIGNGRGKATIYRICTEDPRFPSHTPEEKPATPALREKEQEPATGGPGTRNWGSEKWPNPATLELHTDLGTDLRTDKSSVVPVEISAIPGNGTGSDDSYQRLLAAKNKILSVPNCDPNGDMATAIEIIIARNNGRAVGDAYRYLVASLDRFFDDPNHREVLKEWRR